MLQTSHLTSRKVLLEYSLCCTFIIHTSACRRRDAEQRLLCQSLPDWGKEKLPIDTVVLRWEQNSRACQRWFPADT